MVGIVLVVVQLGTQKTFVNNLHFDIIIDGTTFEWNIHVQRGMGSNSFV